VRDIFVEGSLAVLIVQFDQPVCMVVNADSNDWAKWYLTSVACCHLSWWCFFFSDGCTLWRDVFLAALCWNGRCDLKWGLSSFMCEHYTKWAIDSCKLHALLMDDGLNSLIILSAYYIFVTRLTTFYYGTLRTGSNELPVRS